jgi:hypothetical protein
LNLTLWSPSRTSFEMPTLKRKERYTASQWRSRSFQKSYKCGDLPNKIDSLLASLFQQEQPFVDASIQNEYHGQRLLRHKLVVCTKWQSVLYVVATRLWTCLVEWTGLYIGSKSYYKRLELLSYPRESFYYER